MDELRDGIRRVTLALPLGIDHVHCYLLRATDGSWTVVDTGLGLPDARERWARVVEELDAPVGRIVITHFHPDHVGAAADVAELTGAPVHEGRLDYEQCRRAWGEERVPGRMSEHWLELGMPADEVDTMRGDSARLAGVVRFARDPEPLEPGETLDGWEVLHLPGHADGHLALLRDGVLVAGDALLGAISPNVGLYPDSRPDPLGDFLTSLGTIERLGAEIAYAGHGEPIEDPAGRARELVAHHEERLEAAAAALDGGPATPYEASLELFPGDLSSALRRFALAETAAHLERLVRLGVARRLDGAGPVRYERA